MKGWRLGNSKYETSISLKVDDSICAMKLQEVHLGPVVQH